MKRLSRAWPHAVSQRSQSPTVLRFVSGGPVFGEEAGYRHFGILGPNIQIEYRAKFRWFHALLSTGNMALLRPKT